MGPAFRAIVALDAALAALTYVTTRAVPGFTAHFVISRRFGMLDDPSPCANNSWRQRGIRMSLVKWAIFGLLMLPFVEIAVFIAIALKLGVLAALALTILTSLAGMAVIRNAGARDVQRLRTAFGERTVSRVELDGPGFLTVDRKSVV